MQRLPETCADVRGALPLFVGDDLPSAELGAVRRHLDACAGCRTELEGAQAARAVLIGLRVTQAERAVPDLWPGLRDALVREGQLAPASPTSTRQPRSRALPFVLPAAVAAALLAAFLGPWRSVDSTGTPAATPLAGATAGAPVAPAAPATPRAGLPVDPLERGAPSVALDRGAGGNGRLRPQSNEHGLYERAVLYGVQLPLPRGASDVDVATFRNVRIH